ncbi:MAG: uridine kinase [Bdellovibrionales bacterium]
MKVFGISGGSGSGKTTFTKLLFERLNDSSQPAKINANILAQDNYYLDQSHKFDHDGGSVNFDHPDSIDWDLFRKHVLDLKSQKDIQMPIYDFATHKRKSEFILITPKPYILLDGILILHLEEVRKLMDLKIFIQTNEELRFHRRMLRDTIERGRTIAGVTEQFERQVKPMHDLFVETTAKFADKIISGERAFDEPLIEVLNLAKK